MACAIVKSPAPLDVGGSGDSQLISCTPPYLRFAYDKPGQQLEKICLWNKTTQYIELDLKPFLQGSIFSVFAEKMGAFGGETTTLVVRCNAEKHRMFGETLYIGIVGCDSVPEIKVPIQLMPSLEWFSLPRQIKLPRVEIGESVDINVPLPNVPEPEEFFISIKSPHCDALRVTPQTGILGGEGGTPEIVIRYAPKEYITVVHDLQIHFPGLLITHKVTLYAQASPGQATEAMRWETLTMERWMNGGRVMKSVEPRLRFRKALQEDFTLTDPLREGEEDLTKPAGVVHFLLKKGGKLHESIKSMGQLGMTLMEEKRAYDALEKEFNNALKRERVHQKNVPNQNNKVYLGSDPINSEPALLKKIITQRDKHVHIYEKALGISDDPDDANRTKLYVSSQRSFRRVGEDYGAGKPDLDDETIIQMEVESRKYAKDMALDRFRQATFIVMIRYRVSKRIPKLRILKSELIRLRAQSLELKNENTRNSGELFENPDSKVAHQGRSIDENNKNTLMGDFETQEESKGGNDSQSHGLRPVTKHDYPVPNNTPVQ